MSWKLDGQWTESCTCTVTCPCNLNEDPTYGFCDVAFCFHITEGEVDGLKITDVPVVWAVNLPGAFTAGNATARLYISDNADAEQQAALDPIFKGQKGGVWAVLAGIVADWKDTVSAPIKIVDDGNTRTVTVGDYGTIIAENVRDHTGAPALLIDPPLISPASIHRFEVSRGKGTTWRDPDLKEFEGIHAGKSEFTWSSEPQPA